MASVEHEKGLTPTVPHYVHGVSYGNDVLNEMLIYKPDLFSRVLLDGACVRSCYAR